MKELNLAEIQSKVIAGGVSQRCYDAYKSMVENRGIGDLFGALFLTPFYMAKLYGEVSTVQNICGGTAGYDEAKAAYCRLENPKHCEEPRAPSNTHRYK